MQKDMKVTQRLVRKGFTIIELGVVLAVFVMLLVLMAPMFNAVRMSMRIKHRSLQQVQDALAQAQDSQRQLEQELQERTRQLEELAKEKAAMEDSLKEAKRKVEDEAMAVKWMLERGPPKEQSESK